jgi:hypothetical protein
VLDVLEIDLNVRTAHAFGPHNSPSPLLRANSGHRMTCPACGQEERQDRKTAEGSPSPFTVNASAATPDICRSCSSGVRNRR